MPEQKRLLDAVNRCATRALSVLRHQEPGSPSPGASLHPGVPKAPRCPAPPITQTPPQKLTFQLSSLGSFSLAMPFRKGSSAHSCLVWQRQPEHGQSTTGACLGARGWQETVKGWFEDWHCLLPPWEEKELFHARCILSPQQTDLSGPVGGLCTAIKLYWNCKASLYKSRSKPSIFYDGGHSLI